MLLASLFGATAAATAAAAPATRSAPASPSVATASPSAAAGAPARLRVMSYNLRYKNRQDGEDGWDRRKDFLAATVRSYDPDLLGAQESLAEQTDFLTEALPGYGQVGGGRDDGRRKGEASPIWYRKARFALLASGQYWLSETPEVVGSKGWDAALPRVATWAKLRDTATGRPVIYFNTHWDHMGVKARVESGTLMRRLINRHREAGASVVVTGDFNSTEDQPQYRSLTAADAGGPALTDTFRRLHPPAAATPATRPAGMAATMPGGPHGLAGGVAGEGTFHAFKGMTDGPRIDWILCSPEWVPVAADIVRTSRDGRYPSDHFPVTAELDPAG
jgi:endonuclease/exonuclease/phosphatase family metal-dependent hydrolase